MYLPLVMYELVGQGSSNKWRQSGVVHRLRGGKTVFRSWIGSSTHCSLNEVEAERDEH